MLFDMNHVFREIYSAEMSFKKTFLTKIVLDSKKGWNSTPKIQYLISKSLTVSMLTGEDWVHCLFLFPLVLGKM